MTVFKSLAELFFKSKHSLKAKYSVGEITDGSVDDKGIATLSVHRTPSANGGAKITKIAPGAERLIDGETSILQSDDSVYVEYTSSNGGERVGVIFDGTTVSSTTHPVSVVAIASAIVAYLVREISDYEEFKDIFYSMVEEFEHNGEISDSLYYSLCDSGYFSYLKDKKGFEVDEDLNLYELQMSINNGHFKPLFAEGSDDFSLIKFEGEDKSSSTSLNLSAKYAEMWEEMKRGEWAIPYEWDEESLKNIPPIENLSSYSPNNKKFFSAALMLRKSMLTALEKIECGITSYNALMLDCVNALFTGEPGTGKTIAIYSLAAALQIPCYTIVLSTQTESDEFKGIAQFNDESKIVIKDTNFLHAFTKGGVLILEEINLPDAGLMAGLINQAGEAPYIVLKSNGEQVKRHPLCAMYATMNVGTAGTTPLNESLSSRFPATYVLPNAKKEAFIQALFAKYGNRFTEKQAGWAYDIFTSTHKFLRQNNIQADNIALAVSQRSCFELLKQIEVTGDAREALEDTFYGKVYSYDPEVAEQYRNILDITAGTFPAA